MCFGQYGRRDDDCWHALLDSVSILSLPRPACASGCKIMPRVRWLGTPSCPPVFHCLVQSSAAHGVLVGLLFHRRQALSHATLPLCWTEEPWPTSSALKSLLCRRPIYVLILFVSFLSGAAPRGPAHCVWLSRRQYSDRMARWQILYLSLLALSNGLLPPLSHCHGRWVVWAFFPLHAHFSKPVL